MWEFIIFFRDCIADITGMLDSAVFDIGGIDASLFDLLIGLIALGIVISIFWKGSRA